MREGVERLLGDQVAVDERRQGHDVGRPTGALGGQPALGGHHLGGGHRGQPVARRGHLQLGGQAPGVVQRQVVGAGQHRGAAHGDHPVEQATGPGHRQQRHRSRRPGRLAAHRDPGRVAAERGDVALHPLQRRQPVEHPPVGRRALDGGEPLDAQPVVDRHHDHAVAGEARAPVPGAAVASRHEAATVDPHQHRQPAGAGVGAEHVEVEAVVAGDDRLGDQCEALLGLHRGRPGLAGIAHPRPGLDRGGPD